jgi:hypothetical protein
VVNVQGDHWRDHVRLFGGLAFATGVTSVLNFT